MKRSFCCILLTCLISCVSNAAWSQAAPENWLAPTTATIIRDANAIALLRAALAAMNPASTTPIVDISVKYTVSKWLGDDVSGIATESNIGLFGHSRSVTIGGAVVSHTVLQNGTRTSQAEDRLSHSVSDRRAIENLPYQPVTLVQEILQNPSDEIRLLSASEDSSGEDLIRVAVRGPNWGPEQRDLTSTSLDLYFSQSTHLLNRVTGLRHFDGHPMRTIPYSIVYSDYQLFEVLLLPRSIDERIAGKSTNDLSVTSIVINQGITPSSLQ